jgi:hypothetical protein
LSDRRYSRFKTESDIEKGEVTINKIWDKEIDVDLCKKKKRKSWSCRKILW